MNDEFDDLDRALFALPLETPPPGLRASILNATIYARVPRPAPSLARPWELWACGVALAVATWLVVAIVTQRAFAAAFNADVYQAVRAFAEPTTLSWVAVGCVLAATIWYLGDTNPRLPTRSARF
jgi:hypothetical protein